MPLASFSSFNRRERITHQHVAFWTPCNNVSLVLRLCIIDLERGGWTCVRRFYLHCGRCLRTARYPARSVSRVRYDALMIAISNVDAYYSAMRQIVTDASIMYLVYVCWWDNETLLRNRPLVSGTCAFATSEYCEEKIIVRRAKYARRVREIIISLRNYIGNWWYNSDVTPHARKWSRENSSMLIYTIRAYGVIIVLFQERCISKADLRAHLICSWFTVDQ